MQSLFIASVIELIGASNFELSRRWRFEGGADMLMEREGERDQGKLFATWRSGSIRTALDSSTILVSESAEAKKLAREAK